MTVLSVNVNKIAVLRNSRGGNAPDVVAAARVCLDAGAHGITAHLREDRRHIQDVDIERLATEVTTVLNLEMACTEMHQRRSEIHGRRNRRFSN